MAKRSNVRKFVRPAGRVPSRVEPNTVVIPLVAKFEPKKMPKGDRPRRVAEALAAVGRGKRTTAAQIFGEVMRTAPKMTASGWKDVRWWLRKLAEQGLVELQTDQRKKAHVDEETVVLAEALRKRIG